MQQVVSFVSLLLPSMLMSRLSRRKPVEHYDAMKELRIGGLANAVLEKILDLERALIRAGISFPMGGFLLLVARKP